MGVKFPHFQSVMNNFVDFMRFFIPKKRCFCRCSLIEERPQNCYESSGWTQHKSEVFKIGFREPSVDLRRFLRPRNDDDHILVQVVEIFEQRRALVHQYLPTGCVKKKLDQSGCCIGYSQQTSRDRVVDQKLKPNDAQKCSGDRKLGENHWFDEVSQPIRELIQPLVGFNELFLVAVIRCLQNVVMGSDADTKSKNQRIETDLPENVSEFSKIRRVCVFTEKITVK